MDKEVLDKKYKLSLMAAAIVILTAVGLFLLVPASRADDPVGTWQYNNGGDLEISTRDATVEWDISNYIGQGKAVTRGELTFDVSGFSEASSCPGGKCPKYNLFTMCDGDHCNWSEHSYLVKIRKDAPANPLFANRVEIKSAVDCEWDDDTAWPESGEWYPDRIYKGDFWWDKLSYHFRIINTGKNRDSAGLDAPVEGDPVVEVEVGGVWQYDHAFAPNRHVIKFGKLGPPFYGEPATYSNVTLNAYAIEDSVDLGEGQCEGNCSQECISEKESCIESCAIDADCIKQCNNDVKACTDQCDFDDADEDDTSMDADEHYNSFTCLGKRDDPQSITYKPPGPPIQLSIELPDHFPITSLNDLKDSLGIKYEWLNIPAEFKRFMRYMTKSSYADAKAELSLNPGGGTPGERVTANMSAENYKTKPNRMYSAYFLNDVFANTMKAGGTLSEHAVYDWNPVAKVGPACQPITRTPKKDTDGDGMDDDWEIVNFSRQQDNNPCYQNGVLEDDILACARPYDDPDSDGAYGNRFETGHYDYRELGWTYEDLDNYSYVDRHTSTNLEQEYLVLPPPMVFTVGGEQKLMLIGTAPNDSFTGNAKGFEDDDFTTESWGFANIAEYIAGTDPLDADTDEDGVRDEAELLGEGDDGSFQFLLEGEDKSQYDVIGIILGKSQKDRIVLAADKGTIYVEDDAFGGLKAVIRLRQEPFILGKDNVFVADVAGAEEASLSYEWYVMDADRNKLSACDVTIDQEEPYCGLGKDTWTVNLPESGEGSLPAGTELTIGVRVTNSLSGAQTSAQMRTIVGKDSGNNNSFMAFDSQSQSDGSNVCQLSFDNSDTNWTCVLPYQNLEIFAKGETDGSGNGNTPVEQTPEFLSTHLFEWSVDGKKDIDQSGAGLSSYGKDVSECARSDTACVYRDVYKLAVTKTVGDEYEVALNVIDRETNESVYRYHRTIPVAGALVNIVGCDDEGCQFADGDTATFGYEFRNLYGMSADRIDVPNLQKTWYVDGREIVSGDVLVQSFSGENTSHFITFKLMGYYINSDSGGGDRIYFEASDTISVIVGGEESTPLADRLPMLGSLVDYLPARYQMVVRVSALVFGAILVIMVLRRVFDYKRWNV